MMSEDKENGMIKVTDEQKEFLVNVAELLLSTKPNTILGFPIETEDGEDLVLNIFLDLPVEEESSIIIP
jgi:hypothetical protein